MKRLLLSLVLIGILLFAALATPASAKGRECAGHANPTPPPCKTE
jgi:hypothetical protein